MLNPSAAGAIANDPTIRRCIGFARAAGHRGFTVINLLPIRATDPADLRGIAEAMHAAGTLDAALQTSRDMLRQACAWEGARFICAWGDCARFRVAGRDLVTEAIRGVADTLRAHNVGALCLGQTAKGRPRHPLYVASKTTPTPYDPATDTPTRP